MKCENYLREHVRVFALLPCSRIAKYKITYPDGHTQNVCGYCLGSIKRGWGKDKRQLKVEEL